MNLTSAVISRPAYRAALLGALILGLSGCGRREPEIRHYNEVSYRDPSIAPASKPAMPPMMPGQGGMSGGMSGAVPTAPLKVAWTKPADWTEQPASAMRLASFTAGGTECSVSAFPGETGGEEANLRRWLGQLQFDPDAASLMALGASAIDFKTAAGWSGRLFDLTSVLPAGAAKGMRAAIIPVNGQTLFVKLTGAPDELKARAPTLLDFCKSLRPSDG